MDATISAMKFAVMPMIEMRHMACIARVTVKDAPRAPNAGPGMLTGGGDGFFGSGFGFGGEGFGSGALDFGSGPGLAEDGFGGGGALVKNAGGGGVMKVGGAGLTGRL